MPTSTPFQPVMLQIYAGAQHLATHYLTRPSLRIGRARGCDLVLDQPYIERQHALVHWQGGQWWLESLTPDNPVRYAGQPVQAAVALLPDTAFEVGQVQVHVALADYVGDDAQPSTLLAELPDATLAMSHAQLLRVSYGQISSSYPLNLPVLRIGRDPTCEIIIPLRTVSRHHATLTLHGDGYRISDQHSANGLLWHGRRVQEHMLQHGDTITIADELGNHVRLHYTDQRVADQPPLTTLTLAPEQDGLTIGRSSENALILDHPLVSAQHAVLQRTASGDVFLTDLNSTNGTFVQGERISRSRVQAGNLIQIGAYQFIYRERGESSTPTDHLLRLDALGVQYTLPNRAQPLVSDVTCSIYPHELVALVGGSGTGKSSLLRILAGLQPPQHGRVLLGGEDLYQQLAQYQGSIGYVPQQENLLPYLTVERMLWYAAQLRLPATLPLDAVRQRVDAVLGDVELADVRDQLVYTLSGGQRKRVSIALELLAQPLFLFLDEPTTGLDPALEKRFMLLLRSLAERYCTIVIVTHATASLLLCDRVAVLGSGGRLCFYGAPYELRAFFECSTFAEIYLRVEQSAGGAAGWQLAFRESVYYDEYVEQRLATLPIAGMPTRLPVASAGPAAPTRPARQVRFGRQMRLLAQRYAELLCGDRRTLAQLLLQAALAGSLIRVVAPPAFLNNGQPPQDGQRVIFLLVITAVLLGVLAAARELTRTRAVYERERQIGVQPLPYLLAKLITLVPLAGILAGLLLAPVLIGQSLPHGAFLPASLVGLEWWFGLWLALAGGVCMGLLISAVSRSSDQAMSLVPLVLIVQIMLAGLLVPLTGALDLLGNGIVARGAVQSLGNTADLNRLFYQTYASAPPGIFAPDLPAPPDSFRPSDYDLVQLRQYDAAGQSNAAITRRLHLLRVWAGLLVLDGAWVGAAWLALRAAEPDGLHRKDR